MLLFAVLHYLALPGISGLIFLDEHVPPKAISLDAVISGMVAAETVLVTPRKCILRLWPWETAPAGFGVSLTIINSLVWGLGLMGLQTFWRRAIRRPVLEE